MANLEGAANILIHFTRHQPAHERSVSLRVLSEAQRAWPGQPSDRWWKWFSEASDSLGLRTKTIDATPDEAFRMVREGARLVCFQQGQAAPQGEWLAFARAGGRRYQMILGSAPNAARLMSSRATRRLLASLPLQGSLRCLVVESDESQLSTRWSSAKHPLTPLQRLWRLLRPEGPDIALVLLFAFIVSVLALATPLAVETLVNTVAFGRFLQPILVLATILLTFLGFQSLLAGFQTYVAEIIQRRLFVRVAGDLAYRLPRIEGREDDRDYLPELVNRFFDISTVQKVTSQMLLEGIALVLSTLIGMAVLAFYHPWLLGFDLFLLVSIAVIIFVLGRGAVSSAVVESKHKYSMAAWLEDLARCRTAFRNEGGADFALERADRLIQEYLIARRNHFRILMRQVIFALTLQALASTILLGLGGWLVVAGELTLGQLVAAELIVTVIVGSFAKIGKHIERFYDLLAAVDKLGILFDMQMERQDGLLAIDGGQAVRVQMEDLTFAWPGERQVFAPIDAQIEPGESVAILGGSGSGKSTVLDLMFGLRSPTAGHLAIDGFAPRELRPDILRTRVALARGGDVFQATFEENVHLHRDGVTASDVRDTLSDLGLLELLRRLQHSGDTELSSDGAPLTDGQKKRLGLARAAIGRPGLLLVDGVLDALPQDELDRCLDFLLAPERPWTLVVATARAEIAGRLGRTIVLRRTELDRGGNDDFPNSP